MFDQSAWQDCMSASSDADVVGFSHQEKTTQVVLQTPVLCPCLHKYNVFWTFLYFCEVRGYGTKTADWRILLKVGLGMIWILQIQSQTYRIKQWPALFQRKCENLSKTCIWWLHQCWRWWDESEYMSVQFNVNQPKTKIWSEMKPSHDHSTSLLSHPRQRKHC